MIFSGFIVAINYSSASPLAQQSEKEGKGQLVTRKQTTQNSQNVQSKAQAIERSQFRSSFPKQGYYPGGDYDSGYAYDEYPHSSIYPNYDYNQRLFRPNGGNPEFSSQGFGNGYRPGLGGWNRPTQQRPGSNGGNQGFDSTDDISGGSYNDPSLVSGNGLAGGSQGSDNTAGSIAGNANPQQSGAQPWTTVRSPVNRIFSEVTVPEAECIRKCPSVSNYDPICGSDNITYTNRRKFQCAQECGRGKNFYYVSSN